MPESTRRPHRHARHRQRLGALLLGAVLVLPAAAQPSVVRAADPQPADDAAATLQPTIHYEDALAHADDDLTFAPGDRVTVGFTPRADDRFEIGGAAPRALPAGRESGRAMRTLPTTDPEAAIPATLASAQVAPTGDGPVEAAPVTQTGLRKEVFGFLPYWELDGSLALDWSRLSTVAYFGVGASAAGNLERTSGGEPTVGWSGWTSARMTDLIETAHRNRTRVVLTIQSFAWSDAGKTKQRTLLGSAAARSNLASQIAAAVRDRGADGVNLDFEPIVSGYGDEFAALVRAIRSKLDAVQRGYQLTFDATGYIGNYPLEAATASGAADAVLVMGYDYRTSTSAIAGSIAPIAGPAYDITDTILAYTARVPASKIILGVPYYGRAWSTANDQLNARNISGAKYGSSAAVLYDTAADFLAEHGRRWDPAESVAWTAYRREQCTSTYGCVTAWRQLYVDDATALRRKYDLVNRYRLRGIGIWALGYDAGRRELWNAIRDRFITDTTPPRAGVVPLASAQARERFTVRWLSADDVGVADHDVDVSIDGGPWRRWLTGTTATSATYTGARAHAFAFRVRGRDHKGQLTAWSGLPTAATPARIRAGGFGRVVTDTLNARSAAGTGATILRTLTTGDRVAFLEGPVAADGYTWYRVAAPLASWPVVGTTRTDLWIATGTSSEAFVAATVAPSSTRVTSTATLASSTGADWHPLTPTRILDTRTGTGLGGTFRHGIVRTFQVAGRAGIPADATGITGNLTVTGQTSGGGVAIGASMSASPTTSNLSFPAGRTIANGVTLGLSADGTLDAVFRGASGARTQLILDVTGYFRDDAGATYHPVSPARVLDTRSGIGLGGTFQAATVRSIQVTGRAGVPTDAIAVTGHLTATGATADGHLAIGPTMTARPKLSTLHVRKGVTVANAVTLRLRSGGLAGIVYSAPAGARTHVLFHVTGYFRVGSAGAEWYPIAPVRLLDTRAGRALSGPLRDGDVRAFQLTARGTIPLDARAVTGTITVTSPTSTGTVAIGSTLSASPSSWTLRVPARTNIATGIVVRVGPGGTVATLFDGASGATTHQVLDATGYFR